MDFTALKKVKKVNILIKLSHVWDASTYSKDLRERFPSLPWDFLHLLHKKPCIASSWDHCGRLGPGTSAPHGSLVRYQWASTVHISYKVKLN